MINRVLIRIRIVQILYSAQISNNKDLKTIETELNFSLQKSYDLYYYLFLLLIELKKLYAKRIEQRKSKLLATEEDKNPNTKFLHNKFINQLENNIVLNKYLTDRPMSWEDQTSFVKKLLDSIVESEVYNNYMTEKESNYNSDKEFWRKAFKVFIENNEELEDILEEESIYWNDDIEIVESFVLKSIKRFEESNGDEQELLPMYKDNEDHVFAVQLLRESLLNANTTNELIAKYARNWESERIALMDQVIMQIALTEILFFPNIPINVTLNEYLNIVKAYSTNKSAAFINGILDSAVSELKQVKKIFK